MELKSVKKKYGEHLVIDIPEFKFEDGIYWLKGENGSGKTTLLKLIAGLIPFEGTVTLQNNISLRKSRIEYLRKVNYTEAEPLYPPFITGNEMINLFLKSKSGEVESVKKMMLQLKVNEYADQQIGTYSSGMTKKLSLILAFIGKPEVILLDEPLVTLDTESVGMMYTIINEYHQTRGVNFVITSHHDFEMNMIDFKGTLMMKDKKIIEA